MPLLRYLGHLRTTTWEDSSRALKHYARVLTWA